MGEHRMSDRIILNVHMEAAAGQEEALERQLTALLDPTRAEAGCIAYELHRSVESPGKFMFHECFRDQAALDEHIGSPHFRRFLEFRAANSPDPVASAAATRWKAIG
jgi:quinol monooxygenase YgiN